MASPSEILRELESVAWGRTDSQHELELLSELASFFPPQPFLGKPRHKDWPDVRDAHIEANPSCIVCGTTIRKWLTVHHVKPYSEFPELELVDRNLVTICETPSHNDHFIFGHLCNWAYCNPRVREMADEYLKQFLSVR